jgi:hypothetical protein
MKYRPTYSTFVAIFVMALVVFATAHSNQAKAQYNSNYWDPGAVYGYTNYDSAPYYYLDRFPANQARTNRQQYYYPTTAYNYGYQNYGYQQYYTQQYAQTYYYPQTQYYTYPTYSYYVPQPYVYADYGYDNYDMGYGGYDCGCYYGF